MQARKLDFATFTGPAGHLVHVEGIRFDSELSREIAVVSTPVGIPTYRYK